MKKILCPTDFSETAAKAVEYAAFLAQRAQAHLTLLHVVHLPIIDTSETALVASELLGEQMRAAEDRLRTACLTLEQNQVTNREGGFTCDYILKEALLTDLAEQLTKQEGYDLIVMGTTGVGNKLEELLIGSNAEAVIDEVECPVLAIPANAPAPVMEKIVFASDFADQDTEALGEVLQFAGYFNSTVEVVHVVKESTTESQAKAEQFWQHLQQAFPGASISMHEVVNKHRDEGIKNYFLKTKGSVVAVVRKQKGFLQELFSQSLVEKLTYQADFPLLVLHHHRQ
ncbi:universal stress protein [Pontibacter sp. SGAir0037]|uniref:universal stress protein n=1 Tax=Pontibacter sp. SGAir0037 TaxID=2571030 RepID=UPI0010CD5FA2|nr:universal stress protein [Pontibacter sp. SGAir0037]QCR21278.1 universal stress protein [Pontibacter sp. SGAir0037]